MSLYIKNVCVCISKKMAASFFGKSTGVTELSPDNFIYNKGIWMLKDTGCTAVLFYAPWCGYCARVKPVWIDFAKQPQNKRGVKRVCSLNCDKYQDFIHRIKEDMPQLIMGYPTMIIYKNQKPERQIGTDDTSRSVSSFNSECTDLCSK